MTRRRRLKLFRRRGLPLHPKPALVPEAGDYQAFKDAVMHQFRDRQRLPGRLRYIPIHCRECRSNRSFYRILFGYWYLVCAKCGNATRVYTSCDLRVWRIDMSWSVNTMAGAPLLADIMAVQPMTEPVRQVFYMDFVYEPQNTRRRGHIRNL